MYINGMNTAALNTGTMLDYLNGNSDDQNAGLNNAKLQKAAAQQRSGGTAQRANKAYGGGMSTPLGQAAVKKALAELEGKVSGPITFTKIAQYREQLEENFTLKLKAGLLVAGVDPKVDFSINMNADGKVEIDCADVASKLKIEKYLTDNPAVGEQFGYIQALGNLERARQAGAEGAWKGFSNAKAEIQSGMLEAFFGETMNSGLMDYAGMNAKFSGGEAKTSFIAGLNFTV